MGVSWFATKEGLPNDTEMLFFTLLLISAGTVKLTELKRWATDVMRYFAGFQSTGVDSLPAAWRVSKSQPLPEIYAGLHGACDKNRSADWVGGRLDQICKVIKAQLGHDLGAAELKRYRTV